ncbi:mechanosensitive ion channel [Candidatus Woesearchaeota archaeon]|nr:mechanosensitive ion channel [Candidatus Woesearchaeota archaeon]
MAEINGTFIGNVSFQNFLLFIFVVIITFILGGLLNFMVIRSLKNKIEYPFVYKSLSKIVMYGVYAIGLYVAFGKILHFNIPAVLAAIGVLGVAMLLPLVPILQNIAAGIVLSLERPFKEEDIIEVNGALCKVKDIMLRKTRLRALDGKIMIVPNLLFVTSTPIINYTKGEFIKVALNIDITPDSNKDMAIETIKNICTENHNILPNIPEKKINRITQIFEIPRNFFTIPKNIKALAPQVLIKNVSKEKISLEVWFWIWDITMKEKITSSFYQKLIEEFGKEKINFG